MRLGFSTLALFMEPLENILQKAEDDGFELVELLCEGPYWPRRLLQDGDSLEVFESFDLEVLIHAPTIDLNPASMNPGIREETGRQMVETIELASRIGATTVTTHPGVVHRREDRIRSAALHFALETLGECVEYAEDLSIKFSVENMPGRFSYLCNNPAEHERFVEKCGSYATVDIGHANTTGRLQDFLEIKRTAHYHLSDNNGKRDQHLPLGEGTVDLKLLGSIERGVIELNSYDGVIRSRRILEEVVR
ncbi:sugar phosphate isomerase/epimerase family protein [Methanothermobacter thermautotrophicus]|uniref:sugar phosphate isomerase/epimerase family protein n=1 Tax=Methanothermobacter thermautotrophicus TaxID=145262 RepID=UPI0022B9BB10|nr:sugar phosphate isomerase/epimerase [Methanothermobacter thermautotrophicus]WBF07787.1 sugar phosphate isomerase/epimerase [Methanothermobacter thermautotrophicus]